jgi:hypothetical protein
MTSRSKHGDESEDKKMIYREGIWRAECEKQEEQV